MSFPFKIKIVGWEITRRCNFNCLHCGTSCGAPRDDELSQKQAFQLIDQLGEMQCEIITLSGGEPLMHPLWAEFAKRMGQRNITPYMITNGYYIEENIDRIMETPLRRIGISIDGDEKMHNDIRRNKDSYLRALNGAALLKKRGAQPGIVTHVSKFNLHLLEDMYKEFIDRDLDFWQIQITFASGRMTEHTEHLLDPMEMPIVAKFIEDKRKEKKMMVCVGDNFGYYSSHDIVNTPWQGCFAGRWIMGIEADGTVKGCLSMPPEFREKANVKTRSVKEIWEDPDMFRYNRYFDPADMTGSCSGCEKAADCRGGCHVTAFNTTGSIYDNPYCLYRVEKELAAK